MKKLLLGSAAVGLALSAAPAHAEEALSLDLGGYFKGYGAFVDQDENANTEVKDFDFIRHTEVHLTGETTLDNGLTVGAHLEMDADGGDSFNVQESYVYFSGGWGRVNAGAEDGAAYLLQVAAPAADSNVDGIRQFVQPINYGAFNTLGLTATAIGGVDYDMDVSSYSDKLTYLTPIMNGFQAGVSYTPETVTDTPSTAYAGSLAGVGLDDQEDAFGDTYEAALRYEGMFNNIGVIFGAGYAHSELEEDATVTAGESTDDRQAWNVGLDLDIGPFGIGAAYVEDDLGELDTDGVAGGPVVDDRETIVVGIDYTTGPFKLGASYYNDEALGNTSVDIETDRYTGGVVYTYGPGMTFRGSISYLEHDAANIGGAGINEVESTSVLLGTQINF